MTTTHSFPFTSNKDYTEAQAKAQAKADELSATHEITPVFLNNAIGFEAKPLRIIEIN